MGVVITLIIVSKGSLFRILTFFRGKQLSRGCGPCGRRRA